MTILYKSITRIDREPDSHWVGDGFPVRTLFSVQRDGATISPFLLFDYAGPRHFAPAPAARGVGQHPHRGFETVTIVYHGELEHRDSARHHGHIGPGDVQWMAAAAGVLHEEFHSSAFTRSGGLFEAVQLWVNLPAKNKMGSPRYQTLLDAQIPRVNLPGSSGQLRVIAGDYAGQHGPALTYSPVNVWDLRLLAGKSVDLEFPQADTTIVALLHGSLRINESTVLAEAQAAHFWPRGRPHQA